MKVIGQQVCKSGKITGVTCGPLVERNMRITNENGKTIDRMRFAAYVSDDGDSGSPVYVVNMNLPYRNRLAGVHSGVIDSSSNPNYVGLKTYSHASWVKIDIGLDTILISNN